MQIAKWGNSLAVRLPAKLVDQLGLKEGDNIDIRRADDGALEVVKQASVADAFSALRKLRGALADDFKFDRDACYPTRRGGTGTDNGS